MVGRSFWIYPRLLLLIGMIPGLARIAPAQSHLEDPPPIDSRTTVFLDNEDGRHLAQVEIEAIYEPAFESPRLRLRIRAVGAGVDAVEGYRGIAGANRYTAEMFDLLTAHSAIAIRLIDERGLVEPINIIAHSSRTGFAPERRRSRDGSIDYHSRGSKLPIELSLDSEPLPFGIREIELTAFGEPRFRVIVDTSAGSMSILTADTILDEVEGRVASRARVEQAGPLDAGEADAPAAPPIPIPNWDARDLEGKWVVFARDVADHPEHGEIWVRFLAARNEFDLLAWIALYMPEGFRTWGAGPALAEARAPQWIAVAHFACEAPRGHTSEFARRMLMESDRPTVKAWFARHPAAAESACGAMVLSALEQVEPKGPVDELAPPIDSVELLAALRAGARGAPIRDFADRLSVEDGAGTDFVYIHQIERSLEALTMSPEAVRREYHNDLLAITETAPERVRQAAFLAWTNLDGSMIPIELSLRTLRSEGEAPLVREAAYLALSFAAGGAHPIVYAESIRILDEVEHPAWNAVVSRLGDLGDEFALDRMRDVAQSIEGLSPEQQSHLGESADRLEQSLQVSADSRAAFPAVRVLERTAWLELSGADAAQAYFQWSRQTITDIAGSPRMRSPLDEIASAYECPYQGEGFPCQLLQDRVRELASKFAGVSEKP